MDGDQPASQKGNKATRKIGELPPSSDKDFWGEDAAIHLIDRDKLRKPQLSRHTKLVMRGPYVVCLSCPFEHTIPGYVLDKNGKLKKLDKRKR